MHGLLGLEELVHLIVKPVRCIELDEVFGGVVHDDFDGGEVGELGGVELGGAVVGGAVVLVGDPSAEEEDRGFDFGEVGAEIGNCHFDHGFGEGGAVGGGGDFSFAGGVFRGGDHGLD